MLHLFSIDWYLAWLVSRKKSIYSQAAQVFIEDSFGARHDCFNIRLVRVTALVKVFGDERVGRPYLFWHIFQDCFSVSYSNRSSLRRRVLILVIRPMGVDIIERIMVIYRAIVTVNRMCGWRRFAQVTWECDLVLCVDIDRLQITGYPDIGYVLRRAKHTIVDIILRLSALKYHVSKVLPLVFVSALNHKHLVVLKCWSSGYGEQHETRLDTRLLERLRSFFVAHGVLCHLVYGWLSFDVCIHLFSLRGLIVLLFEVLVGLVLLIDWFYLHLEAVKFVSLLLAGLDLRALMAFSVEDLTKCFATGLLD